MADSEIREIRAHACTGHILSATYFQTVENEANERFVGAFKARFGQDFTTSVWSQPAYAQVDFLPARLPGPARLKPIVFPKKFSWKIFLLRKAGSISMPIPATSGCIPALAWRAPMDCLILPGRRLAGSGRIRTRRLRGSKTFGWRPEMAGPSRIVQDLRRARVLVVHPRDEDGDVLIAHLKRLGWRGPGDMAASASLASATQTPSSCMSRMCTSSTCCRLSISSRRRSSPS